MEISVTDYESINDALVDLDMMYRKKPGFSEDIVEKAWSICNDACERPEFWANGFDMDGGLNAAEIYAREKYPWLTEHAVYMVRHYCMMAMK